MREVDWNPPHTTARRAPASVGEGAFPTMSKAPETRSGSHELFSQIPDGPRNQGRSVTLRPFFFEGGDAGARCTADSLSKLLTLAARSATACVSGCV